MVVVVPSKMKFIHQGKTLLKTTQWPQCSHLIGGTLPCAVYRILSYAGLAVAQPSQAAASVFKSWQASKAGNHPGNVVTKQNLSTAMSA